MVALLSFLEAFCRKSAKCVSTFYVFSLHAGFWALFWYRLSHALWQRRIPLVSNVWPRLTMAIVRCATSIDIHPEAQISSEGILIDHGAGLVVGAHAVVGAGVTLYQGVTLGGTGKRVSATRRVGKMHRRGRESGCALYTHGDRVWPLLLEVGNI